MLIVRKQLCYPSRRMLAFAGLATGVLPKAEESSFSYSMMMPG
jgi:hypothetical protein